MSHNAAFKVLTVSKIEIVGSSSRFNDNSGCTGESGEVKRFVINSVMERMHAAVSSAEMASMASMEVIEVMEFMEIVWRPWLAT